MKFIKSIIIPREDLARLAKIWKGIKHPNVVEVLHYFNSSRGFCIVTEYAPQGNLSDLLKKEGGLSKDIIKKYAENLVQALDCLYSKNLYHGALKPPNILMFGDVIKITDFGLAQLIYKTNTELQEKTGTVQYMAPETLLSKNFLRPADLWSVGIILSELLGIRFPHSINSGSVGVMLWHLTGWHGNEPLLGSSQWPNSDPYFRTLITYLLNKDANSRLKGAKLLERPFVLETREDVEAMFRANTAGAGACDAARPEGVRPLDWYEYLSCTFGGAMLISHDKQALSAVLRPLKDKLCRVEDVVNLNISLEIISRIVDADANNSERALELFGTLRDFTAYLIDLKKSDYNDSLEKCFIVVKKVLANYRYWFGDLHKSLCIGTMDIFKKLVTFVFFLLKSGCKDSASREVLYDAVTCITVTVSEVAQADIKEILYYAKENGVVNSLLSCLIFGSHSQDFILAACEAFRAIWSLLIADGDGCKKIVRMVTKALCDKRIQKAFYVCLRQSSKDVWMSVIQIILRCCHHNTSIGAVLCGLPSSSPVTEVISGGGDNTIISVFFLKLSWYARNPQAVAYPDALVSDLCLVLATVAQSLKSVGRNSAELMLTSSSTKQKSRLSNLAYHLSRIQSSLAPSVLLALATIFSLESSITSSISRIGLPLIPESEKLCDNLRTVLTKDDTGSKLSSWQACMDGTVGLLDARLRWGGKSAIRKFCKSGVLDTLIDLVGGNIGSSDNQIGLSPVGVVWIISLLNHCLGHCSVTIFPLLFTKKYVKLMSGLISDGHLELIKRCGGGKNGVRDIVDAVTGLLESPLAELKGACGHGQKKDRILESIMQIYIESLLMAGIPGQVVKCLEHVELEDAARPVAFLARMTHHRSVIVQILDNGLFHPSTMKRLLGTSSPREVTMNILKIVSDIATMDKVYYEHIERADILPFLRKFLTHEDPKMRMQVCSTISCMCLHSDYFYGLLEKHKIVPLLVACYSDDQDTDTRYFAGTAITNAAVHNELLHKELGRCIPQLAKLLFSAKMGCKTKESACNLLLTLVIHSGKLCQDIIFEGAMEALIILVAKCLLNPRNQPEEKSLLDISLETLEKLCEYSSCRKYLHSSAHYPLIEQACSEATESKDAASVSHIFNKIDK